MRFVFLLAATLSTLAQAGTLSDDVIGNLYGMKTVFSARYAPAAWKKQYANYDLNEQFTKDVALVQSNPRFDMTAARDVFKDFIFSMRDYHTSISFLSTESASLPFVVEGAGDREFIVFIDRTKLGEATFPFEVGDELITFDGQPAADAVSAVQSQFIANVPETDRALAEIRLTSRSGAQGLDVPHGTITIGVKRRGTDQVVNHQLIWDYSAEKIAPRSPTIAFAKDEGLDQPRLSSAFHPMMSVTHAKAETPYDLGARKTFTPDLGTKVWETDDNNNFYAYIFQAPDRKLIGFVRIPAYEVADYSQAVADFAAIIKRFQSTTDAMVIDQVNNPGGSIFYLYALASMLTDQPLHTPLHRMTFTQSDVMTALKQKASFQNVKDDMGASLAVASDGGSNGYPVSYEFARLTLAFDDFVIDQWTKGNTFSEPFWIGGVNQINPAPIHYSKPILLLTNHLDFSGGDFFPATLQDNNRVKILGSRTAGAGGYVLDQPITNNVGIASYRCTGSIAERLSGNPIENLGVKPDYDYEISVDDLTNNYSSYVKAIQSALTDMTK